MKKYGIGVNVGNTGRVEGWNNLLTLSGLYIPSARPDSKYIVESRAEFTDICKNGNRVNWFKPDCIRKECDNTGSTKESYS